MLIEQLDAHLKNRDTLPVEVIQFLEDVKPHLMLLLQEENANNQDLVYDVNLILRIMIKLGAYLLGHDIFNDD